MWPRLLEISLPNGTFPINTYGLMLTLAFAAPTLVCGLRFKKVGINPDHVIWIIVQGIVFGILGARLLHFLFAETEAFLANPLILFDLSKGAMAFMGGAIGGLVGGLSYARLRRLPVWKAGDVAAPTILLGLAVGRLGCFFAGCCHGRSCDLPASSSLTGGLFPGGEIVLVDGFPLVAFQYHRGVGVGAIFDTPVFPTQLWESFGAFLLFLGLSWVWRSRRRFDGQILALTLLAYPPMRYTIELFRGDSIRGTGFLGVFSTSQLVSLAVMVLGAVILVKRRGAGLLPEQEFQDSEVDDEDWLDDQLA